MSRAKDSRVDLKGRKPVTIYTFTDRSRQNNRSKFPPTDQEEFPIGLIAIYIFHVIALI